MIAGTAVILHVIGVLGLQVAAAANKTWDGGGVNATWNTAANWNADANPANTDDAFFNSTFTSGTLIALGANRQIGTITFDTGTTFSISGNALTLNSGSITRTTASSGTQTIASNVTLAANAPWLINGSGQLAVSGIISGNFTLTKSGTGLLVLSGNNTFTGGGLVINAGVVRATTSTGALGAGTLTLGGGSLELANDTGLNYARNTTVSTSGTIFSERISAGAGVTHTLGTLSIGAQTLTLATDSSVTSGTAGLTFGAVTLSASGARFNASVGTLLTLGAFSGSGFGFTVGGEGDTVISGVIGTGTGALTKDGGGTLTLSSANTYTGLTTIAGGTLRYNIASAISTGSIAIQNGATLNLVTFSDTVGGVTLTNGNIIGSGTLTGTTAFATSSGTISAALGGSVGLVQAGSGVTVLSAANSFSGTTTIQSGTISVTSVLAGAVNQPLGTAATLNLGVAATSSGRLVYTGGSGTLSKNVFALGNGTDTIENAGSGPLTLSGTLTKNGTVLRLQGGAAGILVTGTIVGASANSDLAVQGGLTTLSALNTYIGPTFINSSGTLTLGVANAIPSNSAVTIGGTFAGGDGGVGVLSSGTFTNAIGSLAFAGSGGTIRLTPTLSQTSTLMLSATGAVTLAGTSTLDLGSTALTASVYRLIAGSSLSGTFATVTGLDSNYLLRYGTVNANSVDAQRKADQAASFTMTTGTGTRALVNSSVAVSGTITNTSPANSTSLTLGLAASGLTGSGFSAGTVNAGTSQVVSGTLSAGAATGAMAWSITNTDLGAITTVSTATGSLQVVDQRIVTTSTATLALGWVHQNGAGGSTSVVVTSTGLNDVTANAALGSFTGGPAGLSLNLSNGSAAFLGASETQSTTYTVSGSAATLGALSGTFTSSVTPEFGTIPNVVVAVTGSVYSGQSTWASNGGGDWGTFTSGFGVNWGQNEGSPGLDAAFANTDTATFGSALAGGTAAINTNGATVSLKSLVFNNAAGSYEVYQTGGSGPLTLLAAGTSSAGITVSSGSHAIHTDVTLGSTTVVDVALNSALTFHDTVSGSAAYGLTKTGSGTLFFDGDSDFVGNVAIAQGTVSLLSGVTPLGTGAVTVSSGAALDFNFRTITNPLTVLDGGILLNTGTGQAIPVSNLVVFTGTTNGTVNVTSGGTASFQSVVGALVTVNSGGVATFTSTAAGSPSVNVLGGGLVTVAGTAAGSYTVAGTGTFTGPVPGSLTVSSGGVVAFNGSNSAGSTFNVNAGGLANVGSSATIGGQLHVSGSAVISGSVATNADVIVQSGGTVKLVDGAVFSQVSLSNAGTLVVDRSSALTLATAMSGTGGLQKTGTGTLTLTGSNTFTGATSLTGGKLLVNGSLASGVAASASTTLGGSGSIAGTLSGAGLVSPGNSPGILTASAFDPTGGLDAAFEFTAFSPNYAASGTGALNDVLRLTGTSPFAGSPLTSGNVIDVYFNVASIASNQTFDGGFFTGQTPSQLLSSVTSGSYQYWLMTTGSGSRTFNGVNYNPLTSGASGITGVRVQTTQLTTNFGGGDVTGSVTEFVTRGGTLATWTGGAGNGNWSSGGNWSTPVTTSGTFDLVFGGTTQTVTTNNVGTVNVGSITFTNSGTLATGQNAFFTIGGSTLALNNSLITSAAAAGGVFGTNTDGDTISAAMTLAGTSTIVTNNNHNLSISGGISGTGALVLDDGSVGTTEYVYLSGSNSYSGGTQIRGGFAQTGARIPIGSSNNFAFGTGPVTVSDNGTILVRNNSVITNPLTVSGVGTNGSSLIGSFGAAGGIAEYGGPITVASNTRFATASNGTNDTTSKLIISGPVDLGANTLTLRSGVRSGQTIGLLIEVTGTVSGAGGVVIDGAAAGSRVLISGSNSYSGGTTITTGTLIVGNGSALGTGFLAVNTSGLDLNGQSLAVGALSGSSVGVIRSGTGGAARLVTTATANTTYAGSIIDGSGTVGLTKAGSGVLSLTGSNGYTGSTVIDGGVVALDSVNAINGGGAVTFGGGTLRYSAANQTDFSAQFAQSVGPIAIDTNGQIVTYASAIASTNVAGLTKTGSGTLFLNGANAYAGTTTVDAGTLSGTGSVAGQLSVSAGAVFDPGSGPGVTGIFGVGSFAQAFGGTTIMQVTGTTAGVLYDQVVFSGPSKSMEWGGQLQLALSGSYADGTEFLLFSGFTTRSGSLSAISLSAGSPYDTLAFNAPVDGVWYTGTTESGQFLKFNQSTGRLAVVPEPGAMTLAAIGCGICGLWTLRRRLRRQAEAG